MRSTLRERAAEWFGESNLAQMVAVPMGRHRMAFVSRTHLFVYEEREWRGVPCNPNMMVAGLTPKMRADLIAALTKDES